MCFSLISSSVNYFTICLWFIFCKLSTYLPVGIFSPLLSNTYTSEQSEYF